MRTTYLLVFIVLIGLGFAAYQTFEHYFLTTSICDFSEEFSCSAVTESPYGEFPQGSGIAVALLGLIWWIILLWILKNWQKKNQEFLFFVWAGIGVIVSAVLVFIEVYLLPLETGTIIICPFCTVQHVLILVLFIAGIFLLKKPIRKYVAEIFFVKNKINPKPVFLLATLAIIALGGYFILGVEKEIQHYDFAACLASRNATMYGFDACPNCNKQKHIIGVDAFNRHIEGTGRYVKCRPAEEAEKSIGTRLMNISVLESASEESTQEELCLKNVGIGTPTWIINGIQRSGWLTLEELGEMSGCQLPDKFAAVEPGEDRITRW